MPTESVVPPAELPPAPSGPRRVGAALAWTLVFGLSYTQAPLYFSNQNQYFLHGLASAGRGHLADDWLANTRDPTPVFSALVGLVGGSMHENCFYLLQILLLGAYFHSLMTIADHLRARSFSNPARLTLATLLVVTHAGIVRLASAQLTGVDYPWYLQAGVAGQYLLGFGLQPSVCGVFFLVSVAAFLRDRPWHASAWACLAAILHATYLLGAALLIMAYLGAMLRKGQPKQALLLGLATLLCVAPIVWYSATTFAPSSQEAFDEAQHILAHIRIPHHAQLTRWCDAIALGQVAWIVVAVALTWRTRLFAILAGAFAMSLLLTLVQVATGNDTLALLFPWRTSALLMPVATTVFLDRLVGAIESRVDFRRPSPALGATILCAAALTLCTAGGLAINGFGWGYHTSPDEGALLEFVRTHARAGDVYLLPVEIPKTTAGPRGAASRNKNFTAPPRRDGQGPHIAVDLQSFRLATGAAIYVDFKSIPYWDQDVLEWQRRLRVAERLFAMPAWNAEVIAELKRERITHIVAPARRPQPSDALTLLHEDPAYRVYRIRAELP